MYVRGIGEIIVRFAIIKCHKAVMMLRAIDTPNSLMFFYNVIYRDNENCTLDKYRGNLYSFCSALFIILKKKRKQRPKRRTRSGECLHDRHRGTPVRRWFPRRSDNVLPKP